MSDFTAEPWGNTDEDGETGYVEVTSATDSLAKARAWLLGAGLDQVLCPDASRRVVPDGIEPRYLRVGLPATDDLPGYVPVASLIASGVASAWWEFDISRATEAVEDYDWLAEADRRQLEVAERARRRAAEDRGPLWWHYLCGLADLLKWAAEKIRPRDEASVTWREPGGKWKHARVRGWR